MLALGITLVAIATSITKCHNASVVVLFLLAHVFLRFSSFEIAVISRTASRTKASLSCQYPASHRRKLTLNMQNDFLVSSRMSFNPLTAHNPTIL